MPVASGSRAIDDWEKERDVCQGSAEVAEATAAVRSVHTV
jgi:hypothetical protein